MTAEPPAEPTPPPAESAPRPAAAAAAPAASRAQLGQIRTWLKKRDLHGPNALAAVSQIAGRSVETIEQLSRPQADQVINELRRQATEQAPAQPCTPSQQDAIRAELSRLGWGRDDAISFCADTIGHPVDAPADLTVSEARHVIAALREIDAPLDGAMFPEGDPE